MTQPRYISAIVVLSLALTGELTLGLSLGTRALAQFKPPDFGTPRTTAGGATRSDSCAVGQTPLTALVPVPKKGSGPLGLTIQERPSFFLYLPKTSAQTAEFTLVDADFNDVYRTMIPLSGQIGVVQFQLPPDAPPLEVGKMYQWFFNIVCEPRDRLRDAFVSAWIQRVEPDSALVGALSKATPRQRPNVYAQAGIWQDTLEALSELRQTQPMDVSLTSEWTNLLKSVGLEKISGGPPIKQLSLNSQKPLQLKGI